MALILTLIAVGLLLLLVEVYFTPGASIFGIIGIVCIVAANVLAFRELPLAVGWAVFFVSLIITVLFLVLLFRMLSSKNFVVNSELTDKVNVIDEQKFVVGQKGTTMTVLRPNGRAIFHDEIYEVYSQGSYIDENIPVEITRITSDKLFVKPL